MAALQIDPTILFAALISAGPAYLAIRRANQAKQASQNISSQMVEGFRGSKSAVEEFRLVITELRNENTRLRDAHELDRKIWAADREIWATEKKEFIAQISALRSQLQDLEARVRSSIDQ